MNGDDDRPTADMVGANPSANQCSNAESFSWPSKVAVMMQSALPKARLSGSQRRGVLLFLQLLFTLWILSSFHLFSLALHKQKQQNMSSKKSINIKSFENRSRPIGETESTANNSVAMQSMEVSATSQAKNETGTAEIGEITVANESVKEDILFNDSKITDYAENASLDETLKNNSVEAQSPSNEAIIIEVTRVDPMEALEIVSNDTNILEMAFVSADGTVDANAAPLERSHGDDNLTMLLSDGDMHQAEEDIDEFTQTIDIFKMKEDKESIIPNDAASKEALEFNQHADSDEAVDTTIGSVAKVDNTAMTPETVPSLPLNSGNFSNQSHVIGDTSRITESVLGTDELEPLVSSATVSLANEAVDYANPATDKLISSEKTNSTATNVAIDDVEPTEGQSSNMTAVEAGTFNPTNNETSILNAVQLTGVESKESSFSTTPVDALKGNVSSKLETVKTIKGRNGTDSIVGTSAANSTSDIDNTSLAQDSKSREGAESSEKDLPDGNRRNDDERPAGSSKLAVNEVNDVQSDNLVSENPQVGPMGAGVDKQKVEDINATMDSLRYNQKKNTTVTTATAQANASQIAATNGRNMSPTKEAAFNISQANLSTTVKSMQFDDMNVPPVIALNRTVSDTKTTHPNNLLSEAAEVAQETVKGKSTEAKPAPKGSLADFFNKVNTNKPPAENTRVAADSEELDNVAEEIPPEQPAESKPEPKKGSLADFFNKVNTNNSPKGNAPTAQASNKRPEFSQRQAQAAYQDVVESVQPPEPKRIQDAVKQGKTFSGVWGRASQNQDKKLILDGDSEELSSKVLSDGSIILQPSVLDEADEPNPANLQPTAKEVKSKSVNAEFVEGLDDINKLFEGVDPPDELDVGAVGSSIQEVLMGKGAQIVSKRVAQGLREVRKVLVEARDKLTSRFKREEGALVTREEVVKGAQDVWKTCHHAFQGFRGLIRELIGEIWPDDELEDEDILDMALGGEKGDDGLYQFSKKALQESRKLQGQTDKFAKSPSSQDYFPSGKERKASSEDSIEQLIQKIRSRNAQ